MSSKVIHEENVLISEEHCIGEGSFALKVPYVATTLIPYFDLLHRYELIEFNCGDQRNIIRRSTVLWLHQNSELIDSQLVNNL